MNKWAWISYGIAWLSISIAVSVGIYITHSFHCLWFLIIPSLISIKTDYKHTEDKK